MSPLKHLFFCIAIVAVAVLAYVAPAPEWLARFVTVAAGLLVTLLLITGLVTYDERVKAIAAKPVRHGVRALFWLARLSWVAVALCMAYGGHPWLASAWIALWLLLESIDHDANAQRTKPQAKAADTHPADTHPV